jgi:hypothetical protein
MQQMLPQLLTNQAEMRANKEKAKAKANQEDLLARMEEINANQAEMKADRKANQARIEAKLNAKHKKMMAMFDAHHERIMASLEKTKATDFKANPEEMESVMEQQEIPKEDTTVMLVGEPRKQRRVCNLAAERRQKRKERTQGNHESRRKLAAACRKMSHCAKVAW